MSSAAGGIGRIFRPKYPPPGMSYQKAAAAGLLRQVATWRISFACRRMCGQPECSGRHSESTESTSRRDAEKLLRQRLAEIGRGKLITPDLEKTSFADLVTLIENDYTVNGRKSSERLKYSLAHLREVFGHARALAITTDKINAYTAERLNAKAKPATIRCELAALRRMFTLALQAGLLAQVPYIPRLHVSNVRTGFFEEPELRSVLEHLPEELRPVIEFAYLTGWRKREILGLTWRNVDFRAQEIRLEPGTTKNDEGRTFPFSALAPLRDLIYQQREATARDIPWVFHRNGKSITDLRGAWAKACEAAKLPGKLVHDFRRTAVRNLERAGVSRSTAMKLTGHKSEAVYRRYAIVSKADLTEGVAKLARLHEALEPKKSVPVPTSLRGSEPGLDPLTMR